MNYGLPVKCKETTSLGRGRVELTGVEFLGAFGPWPAGHRCYSLVLDLCTMTVVARDWNGGHPLMEREIAHLSLTVRGN